jgi:hypothetical protein
MGVYPYSGSRYDKYWKYENADPSTDPYATRVALEILAEIQDKIRKRGKQIYNVRPEAIIVQDLVHAVIRLLATMFAEHVKLIEKYEKENSGEITNYFGSDSDSDSEADSGEGEDTDMEEYDVE